MLPKHRLFNVCHELLGTRRDSIGLQVDFPPISTVKHTKREIAIDKGTDLSFDVFSKFAGRVSIPVSTCWLAAGTLGGMADCTGLEEKTGSGRPLG